MGSLAPSPFFTGLDNAGVTLVGAKLYTYATGTTTKINTYTDAALTVAHPNPIVLDAAGRAVIYLSAVAYKFVLAPSTDSDPPTSPIKTVDPVGAVPSTNVDLDIPITAGEALAARDSVFLSDGSDSLTAGRWYRTRASGGLRSMSPQLTGVVQFAVSSGAAGSVRLKGRVTGFSGLTTGLTYYISESAFGEITATAPANARVVGVADSTTTLAMGETRNDAVSRRASFSTLTGNVGAGEDILASYTTGLSANQLWANDMGWTGRFHGATASNANAKNLRLRVLDGTNNVECTNFALTASEAGRWVMDFEIKRISATQFIGVFTTMVGPGAGPTSRIGTNMFNAGSPGLCTFNGEVEIRLSGEATTTNDIQVYGGTIYLVK